MFEMTLAEVADAVGGEIVRGAGDTIVSAVSTDSRSVSSGDLFVPLVGEQFDGHDYIEAAVAGGAAAALAAKFNGQNAALGAAIDLEAGSFLSELIRRGTKSNQGYGTRRKSFRQRIRGGNSSG